MRLRISQRAPSEPVYGGSSTSGFTYVPSLAEVRRARKLGAAAAASLKSNPIVSGPIWRVALRIGALPLKVYEFIDETSEGTSSRRRRVEASDHPAYRLLRQPNPVLTRSLMIGGTVTQLLARGAGAWLKVRDPRDGRPFELWPLPTNAMGIERSKTRMIERFTIRVDGSDHPLRFEDVCYFRLLPDPDDWATGFTMFDSLSGVAGMGADAISAASDVFRDGLFSRLWAKAKEELSDPAIRRVEAQLEGARRNKGKIPVLEDLDLNSLPSPDAEIIVQAFDAASKFTSETLGIPGNGDVKAFYAEAVQPIAESIEQELERSLMPEWPEREGFAEFAFRDILRGNPQERIEAHARAILTGQKTPNEARDEEDRGPLDGGDKLFIPLNLVPIDDAAIDGVPRETDTSGGLGGDEGKNTLAIARSGRYRASAKRYSVVRSRVIKGQSKALGNRLRGLLNAERKEIIAAARGTSSASKLARAADAFPSLSEIAQIVRKREPEVAEMIERFLAQTGGEATDAAAALLDASKIDVDERLGSVIADRSQRVSETFTEIRSNQLSGMLQRALEAGTSNRDFAAMIADQYDSLAVHIVDGIARTEVAWAHEQAALTTWADAGVESMDVVFGGGPCTTGICEDVAEAGPYRLGESVSNVGYSFEDADAPPMHPGCTCFAVPHIE